MNGRVGQRQGSRASVKNQKLLGTPRNHGAEKLRSTVRQLTDIMRTSYFHCSSLTEELQQAVTFGCLRELVMWGREHVARAKPWKRSRGNKRFIGLIAGE